MHIYCANIKHYFITCIYIIIHPYTIDQVRNKLGYQNVANISIKIQ